MISIVFGLTTFLTAVLLLKSGPNNWTKFGVYILVWLAIYTIASLAGFFQNKEAIPPRFMFLPIPALLVIATLFMKKIGRAWIDKLNIQTLVALSIVRIPVEWVLFQLYQQNLVPVEMTFEGRNFDILSGLSAPFIAWYCFSGNFTTLKRNVLLGWNFLALGLLLNVVVTAVLAAPTPLQKIAFYHPNVAILAFPYVWLPSFIVPVVLFTHLMVFRKIGNFN